MIWAFIVSCTAAIVFGVRLFQIKRQLYHITVQLNERTDGATEKKITVSLIDENLNELAAAVNRSLKVQQELRTAVWRNDLQLKDSIANLSHDLRTPLTSISGYLQLLQNADCPAEKRNNYMQTINNKANVLKTLINSLYELCVLDIEQQKREKIDFNYLISDVLAGQYELFHKLGIELKVSLPDSPVLIFGDRIACTRILQNLLNNITRYSKEDAEIVLEERGAYAHLSVCNFAPGLSQQNLEHLFERFYTADQSRNSGGSGLGLSIVKTLLIQMGGTIDASLKGQNLCLTVELPLFSE
jgi:signal transduction histidine kinase